MYPIDAIKVCGLSERPRGGGGGGVVACCLLLVGWLLGDG